MLVVIPGASCIGDEPFAVIGYLPKYRIADIDPARLKPVTDLVYFGIVPTADGQLSDHPVEPSVLQKLHEIKRVANCSLLISVGGARRSAAFSELTANAAARRQFIANLVTYCRDNGFDGVDYDWEHPADAQELAAYARLLAETKAATRDTRLLVTIAQAGWQDIGQAAYRAVDRVHLMSYDHDFPQATMEKSCAEIDRLISWGCPPEKLALGIPFYGRNNRRDARTYRQLISESKPAASADVIDGFALNGPQTVSAKTAYAIDRGLAGIMIWELGQDTTAADASLLNAISQQLQAAGQVTER